MVTASCGTTDRGRGGKQSAKSFFDLAQQARQESNLQPPVFETAGLHSAVETPRATLRVADRSPTPPLTRAACAVTVSVTVSGATLCWSAARLAETPLRF